MGFGVCFSVNTFFPFYFNFYLHFVNFFLFKFGNISCHIGNLE